MGKTFTAKDRSVVASVGFLIGALALIPIKNLGIALTPLVIVSVVVGCMLFALLALGILYVLGRRWEAIYQFGKFAAVGTLNSLVDLAILNLLILLTDVASGGYFTLFKTISAFAGKNNSYFWNKMWAFGDGDAAWRERVVWREYIQFIFFTFIGLLLNVGIASLIVNIFPQPPQISEKLWANIGAVIAMLASMFWNFLSYRWVVFKRASQ